MKKSYLLIFFYILSVPTAAEQLNSIDCVKDIKESFYKSNEFKNSLVRFLDKDKELKEKMVSHFSTDQLRINDLEKFFIWDRNNGMKFIYKILDLMDRNYLIDESIGVGFMHYRDQFERNCSTID
jgi:vacuolar-type H+-ATPase subunit D/Vma8